MTVKNRLNEANDIRQWDENKENAYHKIPLINTLGLSFGWQTCINTSEKSI